MGMDGSVSTSVVVPSSTRSKEKREPKGYWISFLDGLQRTILFTERFSIIENIRRRDRTLHHFMSVSVELKKIGVSIVNDEKKREILYLGLKE